MKKMAESWYYDSHVCAPVQLAAGFVYCSKDSFPADQLKDNSTL